MARSISPAATVYCQGFTDQTSAASNTLIAHYPRIGRVLLNPRVG
jgi:hypothetical protein